MTHFNPYIETFEPIEPAGYLVVRTDLQTPAAHAMPIDDRGRSDQPHEVEDDACARDGEAASAA